MIPLGQKARNDFPRFGLPQYAARFPANIDTCTIEISINGREVAEIDDLLADDVLVADTLDGQPLSIEHGAPLRLVAPRHYGYKNLKHLSRIQLHTNMPVIKRGIRAFLDHPRARVSEEERGRWIPGWVLRHIYRLMIPGTVKDFEKAMQQYRDARK